MSINITSKPIRTTLRESTVDLLRTAIFGGDIPAGTHLAEVSLSASLGVSRATLREALRQLQQEGLAVQDSRGRVSVREVSPQEVEDLFEVRLGLETIAARRLCERPDRSSVVTELTDRLERLRRPESLAADLDADLEFHGTMCRLSGNQLLLQSWEGISSLARITMLAAGPDSARANMAYDRHAPIVDLIARGDSAACSEFLADHMASARDRLIRSISTSAVDEAEVRS
ncbi:GntR family transcriptional regulator [Amycolatopsis sp. CA-161197]|uniref:GntR family transcriptional regulator n=1 Tax=unclassified Amycolatopsis TaxID=2618356 RepID=UPI003453525C